MPRDRSCEGKLVHRRCAPVVHEFSYPVWMLLVDIDGLGELDRKSHLLSVDRPNLLSLRSNDYLEGPGTLRDRVTRCCHREGLPPPSGPVLLLTQPRSFGFDFNPVSFFLCLDATAQNIEHVIAEVTNTPWNERHVYVVTPPHPAPEITCESHKALHVSPFNGMDLTYRWHFRLGDGAVFVSMAVGRDGVDHFHATLDLVSTPLDAATIRRGALLYPAQSVATLARIYRQAGALWLKRAPFYVHPDKRESHEHTRAVD